MEREFVLTLLDGNKRFEDDGGVVKDPNHVNLNN